MTRNAIIEDDDDGVGVDDNTDSILGCRENMMMMMSMEILTPC